MNDLEKKRLEILELAQPMVASEGWSESILQDLALANNIASSAYLIYFPEGTKDLFAYNIKNLLMNFRKELQHQDFNSMKVREKIAAGTFLIFQQCQDQTLLKKNIEHLLSNFRLACRTCWQLANIIWYKAGDKSVDYNYYTKRSLLVPVIVSASFYVLQDTSLNLHNTEEFIKRRIDEILIIEIIKKKLSSFNLDNIPFIRLLKARK